MKSNKAGNEVDANLAACAREMLDELEHLVTDCIETDEYLYADGTPYTVEKIVARESAVNRIRQLIANAKVRQEAKSETT